MTVYKPQITDAFYEYSTHFEELLIASRSPIIDLNAINQLSELRENWQNTTTTQDEHVLSVTAGTDDDAYLETSAHGQYAPGAESQCGQGIRVPTQPSNDEVIRWGYYDVDSNGEPRDGFFYGVDSTGIFVGKARSGTVEKVYQDNWNADKVNGSGLTDENVSGEELVLDQGNIFQIDFTYYGYGPIEMKLVSDAEELVTIHRFFQDGNTSVNNTNLPVRQDIVSNGTNSDALDLFVGGRQFSVLGPISTNERSHHHYRDSLSGVDDTKWYPAISIKLKDGTDVGSTDFGHVLVETDAWEASNGNAPMRWQVRRNVTLDQTTWKNPSSATDSQSETAMKVDTTATSITDGSGNLTGVHLGGGTLPAGNNKRDTVTAETADGRITEGDIVTLVFQAQPKESGAIEALALSWVEDW